MTYWKNRLEDQLPRHRVQRPLGHTKPELEQKGVKIGVNEHCGVRQTLLLRSLDADPEHHVVARRNGHRPHHVGKIGALQNLSLVAFFDAHEFNNRPRQVGSPAIKLDGDGVLVEDGEEVFAFFGHAERAEVDDVLTRRAGKKLKEMVS